MFAKASWNIIKDVDNKQNRMRGKEERQEREDCYMEVTKCHESINMVTDAWNTIVRANESRLLSL